MRLEETTFYQLEPGDLFFYPTTGGGATAVVQVRDDSIGTPKEGDAKVVRVVPDPEPIP